MIYIANVDILDSKLYVLYYNITWDSYYIWTQGQSPSDLHIAAIKCIIAIVQDKALLSICFEFVHVACNLCLYNNCHGQPWCNYHHNIIILTSNHIMHTCRLGCIYTYLDLYFICMVQVMQCFPMWLKLLFLQVFIIHLYQKLTIHSMCTMYS